MSEQKVLKPKMIMPEQLHYASAYIPYQYFCNILDPEQGLQNGTIFPELIDSITEALL